MTKDEAIEVLIANYPSSCYGKLREAVDEAIESLETDVSNAHNTLNALNCISRQDAINGMMALQAEDDEDYGCRIPEGFDGERAKEALEQLPSAQPEPELIRCGECRYRDKDYLCSMWDTYITNDAYYCGSAERGV